MKDTSELSIQKKKIYLSELREEALAKQRLDFVSAQNQCQEELIKNPRKFFEAYGIEIMNDLSEVSLIDS